MNPEQLAHQTFMNNQKIKRYQVTFTAPEIVPCSKDQMRQMLRNPANYPLIESIEEV